MDEFTGQEPFQARQSLLFQCLGDAAWLAGTVPNATIVESSTESAKWTATPAMPFVTGTIETTLTILPSDVANEIRHAVQAASRGTGCSIEAIYQVNGDDTASTVDWRIKIIEKTGLLKLVPGMMLRKYVQEGIAKAWGSIRNKLEAE